jgi:hypothetical protein
VNGMTDVLHLPRMSLSELLALRSAIDSEIRARGYTRTATSLEGELMERLVADAYGGALAPPTSKSVDVILPDERTIQVKVRSLPRGDTRFWQFKDFDFDLCIVVSVDRDTSEILFARELTSAELEANAVIHAGGGYRLRMGRARMLGLDVTDRLQAAHASLR